LNQPIDDLDRGVDPEFSELKRDASPAGGRTRAVLLFLCGLGLLGGCGWWIVDGWRHSNFDAMFGLVLGALLGLTAVYWQWRPLRLMYRTALPHGEIFPPRVVTGEEFTFRYRQPVRQPLRADVTASLVLRETIPAPPEDNDPTPTERDHLVAARTEQGLQVPAGGLLQMQCAFRLPAEMRDFPVQHWPVQCVVKVHVRAERGADYWEEFALPSPVDASSPVCQSRETEAEYQVTLVSFPQLYRELPPPPPLDEYLPHLVRVDRLPLVLLRGITRAEAERACRRLEAAGGVVELACGGRVIERQQTHNLPVPVETARTAAQGLPVPGAAPDRPV
jgi:hypothetical protein